MERASEAGTAGLLRRPAEGDGDVARGATLRWRALAAPLVLAAYSIVAAVGAGLALAPAVLAGGPLGRRRAARAARVPQVARMAGEEEREALGG